MFRYINNLLEDRRINRRTLAFGISFTLAAFVLTKSSLIQRLKEKIMGTKASCCQSNTHNSLSSEINVENFPYTKKLNAISSEDQQQFLFVQSSSLNKEEGGKSQVRSILKKSSSFESSQHQHHHHHHHSSKKKEDKPNPSQKDEQKDEKMLQISKNPPLINTNQSNSFKVDQVQEVPKLDDSVKVETRGALNIIYGTTGGNSARLAANLLAEARQQKYQPKLVHLGDFDATHFTNMDRAIFVISTYGVGGPTNDAQVFYDWIQQQENSTLFSHLKYVVFGLGNSTFENFAGFGVKIDAKLESLGAKRLYPLGKGNAAEDTTDQDFNKWKENLWATLNEEFKVYQTTLKELRRADAGFELKIKQGVQELDFDNYAFDEKKIESRLREYFTATNAPVKEIRELRQKPQESSCLHVDYDLSQTQMKYDTAGNLGIYPENDLKSIQDFATLQGYNLEDIFDLEPSEDRIKLPLPTPMKVSTFLSKFCDLFGPVNKIILQGLAELSGNAQLIAECDKWVNDNDSFEKNIREKNHSIFSLSKQYQIRIPLLNLIKISNRIFPRFYTISSSNKAHPKNLHMCISISKVTDPSGSRNGQASSYFTALSKNYANKRVRIFHQESTFKLPSDKTKPIVMVGPGAGLAPFRAFLQEKKYLEDNNQNTTFGHSVLYFGCRGKKVDYIYQNDLEGFEKSNTCNKLRLAFSRDGPEKVYVQDLMQQDLDDLADLFLEKGATIYVCGSKAVGESVKEFIINMYQEKEGLIPYLAYSKISELESDKRIVMEVWG